MISILFLIIFWGNSEYFIVSFIKVFSMYLIFSSLRGLESSSFKRSSFLHKSKQTFFDFSMVFI